MVQLGTAIPKQEVDVKMHSASGAELAGIQPVRDGREFTPIGTSSSDQPANGRR